MTGASYVPGSWLGVVRSGTAVLLGPESPAELAGALWELLAARPEPHEVLAAVTSSSGGSLARIPSFGILDFNGSLRVFLRGNLDLRVEQPGGAVDLDGRDVTTWNERRFVVPGMCRLDIADGGGDQPELPLGEGVVLLQALTFGVPSGPAAVAAPAAQEWTAATENPAAAESPVGAQGQDQADNPVVVESVVALDSPGMAGDPGTEARSTGTDFAGQDGLPGTLVPEHGASAETVLAVLDEDQEGLPADTGDAPEASGEAADPDATIAPGAIIPPDPADASGTVDDVGPEGEAPPAADAGSADAAPAVEMTTSYDHLWDRTVMRNIEDAAVREDPDSDSALVAVGPQPALPAAGQLAALGAADDASTAGQQSGSDAGPGTGADGSAGGDPAWGAKQAPN